MTNQRAIILLSQMYLPAFDEEEKDALTKAIEALTEQEPRVLTIEEVKAYPTDKALWFEGKEIIPVLPDCRAEQQYENQLGVEVVDTFYDFPLWFDSYNLDDKFGWRCWSAKPTDEQRETIHWERIQTGSALMEKR